MAKIQIKLGGKTYDAKIGIGFIGAFIKEEKTNLTEMFEDFQNNPFYIAPKLMYHAIKKADSSVEITADEIEDMIDADGGFNCAGMLKFIEDFGNSLATSLPDEGKGKPQKKVAAKK